MRVTTNLTRVRLRPVRARYPGKIIVTPNSSRAPIWWCTMRSISRANIRRRSAGDTARSNMRWLLPGRPESSSSRSRHHDPKRDDAAIDALIDALRAKAQHIKGPHVFAAAEGQEVELSARGPIATPRPAY